MTVSDLEKLVCDYDIAMSFAGEDRIFVEEVAHILLNFGFKVFYDYELKSLLLGKNLSQFLQLIFKDCSRFAVIFISENYLSKSWCELELASSLVRAAKEKYDYILPIMLDETKCDSIGSDIGYISAQNLSPKELAAILVKKLSYHNLPSSSSLVYESGNNYIYYLACNNFERIGRHGWCYDGIDNIACLDTGDLLFLRKYNKKDAAILWKYPYKSTSATSSVEIPSGDSQNYEYIQSVLKILGINSNCEYVLGSVRKPSTSRSGRLYACPDRADILFGENGISPTSIISKWLASNQPETIESFEIISFSFDERYLIAVFVSPTFEGDWVEYPYTLLGAIVFAIYPKTFVKMMLNVE